MINCITIDDEPLALKQMVNYIQKTPFLNLVAACESALEALNVLNISTIDLMFVDINMPDLQGVDFVKSLVNKPFVIFTTAYSQYAIDGFLLNAIDYLLKPIAYNDFLKAANKALIWHNSIQKIELQTQNTPLDFLFVKTEHKLLKIRFEEIFYIEGMREYVRIHMGQQKIMSLMTFKSLESILPIKDFMRIHRSYIINLNKIVSIEKQSVLISTNKHIPIGEQYKDKFQSYISNFFIP